MTNVIQVIVSMTNVIPLIVNMTNVIPLIVSMTNVIPLIVSMTNVIHVIVSMTNVKNKDLFRWCESRRCMSIVSWNLEDINTWGFIIIIRLFVHARVIDDSQEFYTFTPHEIPTRESQFNESILLMKFNFRMSSLF